MTPATPGPALRRVGAAPAVQRVVPVQPQSVVAVLCQKQPGGPGYITYVAPGQPVTCANGAIPHALPSP